MQELFSRIKKPKVNLFRDRTALTPKHLLEEDEIVDREKEIQEIAEYVKKILAADNFKALFIYGPSGSGKTAMTRYVFSRLQFENVDQALPIYINCFDKNSKHSLLTELMRFFFSFYDGKGRGSDEILEEFSDELKAREKIAVIALDNFDKFSELESLLWSLNDLSHRVQFGLILISTGKYDMQKLGYRIKSALSITPLFFSKYDAEMLFEILKSRTNSAFVVPIPEETLWLIAEYAAKREGNAKIAFNLLLQAAENAQWDGSESIEKKYAEEAILKMEKEFISDKIREIEKSKPTEFRVFHAIAELQREKKQVFTGALLDYIQEKKISITARTLANYLRDLEERELIETRIVVKGRGRSKEIKLKIPEKLIE